MSVPLLDLKAQYEEIKDKLEPEVLQVLRSGVYIKGPRLGKLEEELARYCSTRRGVACASGTDALLLALMAFGVGPGDEVVTTPYTFFATAGSIARLGARPVFVDIDPRTYNIDPDKVGAALSEKTRAIIPVHLYGQCADMDPILELAGEKEIPVIEDAAQSIGALYKGRKAGSLGAVGCFSFFPSKNLGTAGDGGLMTTDDDSLAEKLIVLREHGAKPKYYHSVIGLNSRLDALHAAILLVKLPYLESWHEGRRRNAGYYNRRLAGLPLALPYVREDCVSVFNQYVIRTERRDALQEHLQKCGIGNAIYYPVPLHLQECYAYLGCRKGDLPEAERAARETLAIPVNQHLTEEQLSEVAGAIREFFE